MELARDNFEGKKAHGCVSWGVIGRTTLPSPLKPRFLPSVLQKADRPINFTSYFIAVTLLVVGSGTSPAQVLVLHS